MKKVLVIDEFPEGIFEGFFPEDFSFDLRADISPEAVEVILPNYEGLLLRSKMKIEAPLIQKCHKLEFIARSGAGLENIDVRFAKDMGVKVFNSPEGNKNAVAEHALGMLLSLLNHLPGGNAEVKAGRWNRLKNRGTEIADKSLAVIGCGNMGSHFAQKAKHLFAEVLVYDKYKSDYAPEGTIQCTLEEIFERADVVSLHVNLLPDSKYLFNADFISRFKKPFYVINTSRGKVLKTIDLVQAIDTGKVLGACLDVLEYEGLNFEELSLRDLPPAFQYLVASDSVMLSPHVAGWTHESARRMPEVLLRKIAEHYQLL